MCVDICENCYEEATLTKKAGMMICRDCKKDMNSDSAILDNFDTLAGVMSDEDVITMYRDEYAGY